MKRKWRGTTAAERTSSPPPKKVKVDAVDLRMVQSAIEHLKEENERLTSELSRVAEEARRARDAEWLALHFDGKHPADCVCPNCGYGL